MPLSKELSIYLELFHELNLKNMNNTCMFILKTLISVYKLQSNQISRKPKIIQVSRGSQHAQNTEWNARHSTLNFNKIHKFCGTQIFYFWNLQSMHDCSYLWIGNVYTVHLFHGAVLHRTVGTGSPPGMVLKVRPVPDFLQVTQFLKLLRQNRVRQGP